MSQMSSFIFARTNSENLNLLIDFINCNTDYIIEKIEFINLVMDRWDAGVHLVFLKLEPANS